MNKLSKISLLVSVLLSITAITISMLTMRNDKTIYFVNNGKLYDGFSLKVSYERQVEALRMSRKNMLDSIELTIKQLDARQMPAESKYAQEYYMEKARTFEEEEQGLLTEYNQQIWKRLNQYAEEFSKEKHIDILFGATGNGTLLHANAAIDLTDELIAFSNKRYGGKDISSQ
jgi:outer membrane protein